MIWNVLVGQLTRICKRTPTEKEIASAPRLHQQHIMSSFCRVRQASEEPTTLSKQGEQEEGLTGTYILMSWMAINGNRID